MLAAASRVRLAVARHGDASAPEGAPPNGLSTSQLRALLRSASGRHTATAGDHGPGARRHGNGDALDHVRAGFAKGKSSCSAAASVGRRERSSPAHGAPYAPRRSQRACPSTADKAKGEYTLLSTPGIWRTGGLAARPESCRIIASRSQNLRKWEARNACVVVDVWVARGRRTNGGDSRCSLGRSARRCGCARRRTSRSCW